jgi:hypothetical protein
MVEGMEVLAMEATEQDCRVGCTVEAGTEQEGMAVDTAVLVSYPSRDS